MIADVEPHLRTEGEIRELQPRVDFMAERMCQTQGMVLWALKEAGLTVVLLDPHAREIAPDGAEVTAAEERGRRLGVEERDELRALLQALRPLMREEVRGFSGRKQHGWEKILARIDAALAPRDSGKDQP